MHYVNRTDCVDAPLPLLVTLNIKYKKLWSTYNIARNNPKTTTPNRPNSGWLDNKIRHPLSVLFYKDCGYCGIHTVLGNDAEVDHHFPTSLDLAADKVFCWENYVWGCHSCNGMKNNHYPFLDPCLKSDMEHIYFNADNGKYMYYDDTPADVQEKFINTEKFSNLNDKNRPAARKCVSREVLEIYLSDLRRSNVLYLVEKNIHGEESKKAKEKLDIFNQKKGNFLEKLKNGNYLLLIKDIFETFCINEKCNFPFTFENLIEESNYLKINGYN